MGRVSLSVLIDQLEEPLSVLGGPEAGGGGGEAWVWAECAPLIRSGLTCDALEECVMLLGRVRAIDCVLRAVEECTREKETDSAGGEGEWSEIGAILSR